MSAKVGAQCSNLKRTTASKEMAGGPMLEIWDKILPLVKDLRVRFALAMLGNALALWFIVTYFKKLIPEMPVDFL